MRFTLPRDIYHGEGTLEELRRLSGKRAVIVTGGSSMQRFGIIGRIEGYLHEAGMETSLIEGVEPDPSVETVLRGAGVMRQLRPDWIVAVGGGSPIDAAKAMWVFYEHPEVDFKALTVPFGFPKLRNKARFCAIPSTSGTATEVTAFSVITDYQNGIKYPLADFEITPDVAIVDPALARTMPRRLAAYTGMDAFTHATEAYVSTLHSEFTDPLALHALELIDRHLVASCDGDRLAREKLHDAQCLAGMAFSNALLGIVHSMAHKTGAAFGATHIVHGCANAMYLPTVIRFNARVEQAQARYAVIARRLGLSGASSAQLVEALIGRINELNRALGIPRCIREYENGAISEHEYLEKLPEIARQAVADACTGSNPRPVDEKQMEQLLRAVYYGEPLEI